MSEPRSLDSRIGILRSDSAKRDSFPAVMLGCLAVALVAVAAEVTPPNVSRPVDGDSPALSLAPEILEQYVGFYVHGGRVVILISREGSHLFIQPANGVFPRTELLAATEIDFWVGVFEEGELDTFLLDEQGRVTGLLEHNDRPKYTTIWPRVDPSTAQQILADNQVRFQRQTAVPGSEAALRGLIDGVRAGKCINEQAAWLKEECEETMANLHWDRIYASWGAVQSVKFRHVNDVGQDVYDVRQERGLSEWAVYLDDKGIIQDVARSDPH